MTDVGRRFTKVIRSLPGCKSMLEKHAKRCRIYCAIDYEPEIGNELTDLARRIQKTYKPDSVKIGAQGYQFLWPKQRRICILRFQRLSFQTLGLEPWNEWQNEFLDICRALIDMFKIEQFKRVGLKTFCFFPLSMTHSEMCDLMFGSFLAPKESLERFCGTPSDPLAKIGGEFSDMTYNLIVSPMTPDQAVTTLRHTENLDLLIEDNYLDDGLVDFFRLIREDDSFHFDIDLFRHDIESTEVPLFLKNALSTANKIAEDSVRHLQSKPPSG